MEQLYSLYDALVGIHVPSDKARAVVDAMERDMLGELATKSELRAEVQLLRQEITSGFELLAKDIAALEKRMDTRFETVDQRFDSLKRELKSELTVRLGSMLAGGVVVLGVLQKLL